MLVLGYHGTHMRLDEENRRYHGHDSAAVLLDDGVLVAAIEEERLNRVKHSNYFPVNAIKFCARQHGIWTQAAEDEERRDRPQGGRSI